MRRVRVAIVGVVLATGVGLSAADQWPQFRGPQAGVAPDDPALPDSWSETENVIWKADIGGRSTPMGLRKIPASHLP